MKLSEYVQERIEGLFKEMAGSISAGEVALDDFVEEEYPAVVTALMLDVMPVVVKAAAAQVDYL